MTHSLPLLLAIGEVCDQHLTDVEHTQVWAERRSLWMKIGAVAACLAVTAVAVGTLLARQAHAIAPPLQNDPSSAYVSTQMPGPVTLSSEELIERADVIVAATVAGEWRRPLETKEQLYITDSVLSDHNTDGVFASYWLLVDVEVTDVLKGNVAVGDILRLSNGALEDVDANGDRLGLFYWSDTALMKQGDRVLLFLKKPFEETDEYRLVGEAGKWFGSSDNTYRCGLLYDARFPEDYTPRIGLTDYTPRTLEEWRSMITEQ